MVRPRAGDECLRSIRVGGAHRYGIMRENQETGFDFRPSGPGLNIPDCATLSPTTRCRPDARGNAGPNATAECCHPGTTDRGGVRLAKVSVDVADPPAKASNATKDRSVSHLTTASGGTTNTPSDTLRTGQSVEVSRAPGSPSGWTSSGVAFERSQTLG